jgi:hypothetical protein
MKYLIFTRPFTKLFTSLYKDATRNAADEILYISDFKYEDDVGLIELQYKYINEISLHNKHSHYHFDEVINRCRYLRNINLETAKKLVISTQLAIQEVIEKFRPDCYIGLPIDNYILHLMHLECSIQGIKNISPVQSFLPNRTRITSLGEWVRCREVDAEEVDKYYEILTKKSFKPTWLKSHRSFASLGKLYIKERLKKIYFEFQKIKKGDPYSFHYNTIYPAKGVISIDGISNVFAYKKYQARSMTEKLLSNSEVNRKLIYLPLQFSPETTIDYYINDLRFGRYEELVCKVLSSIPNDVTLIVKEHPDLYGFRNPKFYDKILENKNVHLAGVDYPTSEILHRVDAVIVTGGGSTGAEAIIRGIRTISLGGCFYSGPESMSITNFDCIEEWTKVFTMPQPTVVDRKSVLKRILENTVEGPYDFVRSSKEHNDRNTDNLKKIIRIIH